MKKLLTLVLLAGVSVAAHAEPYTLGIPERKEIPNPQWASFRFQASPVVRLKSDYTNTGTGGEAGVMVLYDKAAPSLGLFVGYFPVEDRFAELNYVIVPITLRASYDMQMTPGGVYFTIAVEGGGAINSFKDVTPAQSDVRNSPVVGGQLGLKFIPPGSDISLLMVLGYQYLNPEVLTGIPGGFDYQNRNLGAPYLKLGLEF